MTGGGRGEGVFKKNIHENASNHPQPVCATATFALSGSLLRQFTITAPHVDTLTANAQNKFALKAFEHPHKLGPVHINQAL